MAPGRPNLMIFGPIACFRRPGSRFSGQNRPRSSEMRVYIKNKKSSKFQNFILVPGVRKTDFPDFSGIFTIKLAGNSGINDEWDDLGGCRDPGNRYRQPASSPRDNGFSVLRIFLIGHGRALASWYLGGQTGRLGGWTRRSCVLLDGLGRLQNSLGTFEEFRERESMIFEEF